MKLHAITFGCQMNEADSEEMALPLLLRGYQTTSELSEADAVLVNTCTVREHAEHRAVSRIGRLRAWKAARPGRLLIVAGCAAERLGEALRRKFPFVDLVVGARSIEDYPALLDAVLEGRPVTAAGAAPAPSGYVTVMRGCNYACAYCIVPSVRGRESHLPFERILRQARERAERGSREIFLLGQTVNSWKDSAAGKDFSDLLRAVGTLPGVGRVRFMSPHPVFLDERLSAAMAETPAAAPHLHLPAQSGSDRILQEMRRGHTRAQYLSKVRRLREAVPGLHLTTDFIVGFPGETEEDFRQTLSLAEECGAGSAYCSKFSPREGTLAASLEGQLEEAAKEERLARLLAFFEARQREVLEGFRGRRVQVLLETPDTGRTEHNLCARLAEPRRAGELVEALVCGCTRLGLKCSAVP
ncbi:MAG TPA: tRNA (N6-isopentenyl adenosine(37)-C2)-methylthiotransferase MiaB [Elusimicrobia bacterium]|nr:tRNA (N6-isopentenyl adenosine(37)-C2)-methylthiotransferase MiaB [Elusimicrobiota bacterium]